MSRLKSFVGVSMRRVRRRIIQKTTFQVLSGNGFLQGALSQILRGKRSLPLATIVKLARALDVSVADFFKGS